MAKEIERKFLVKDDTYKAMAFAHRKVKQGYISSTRGKTVRVRIMDDKGFLTIKGPSDEKGLGRYEWEKEIPVNEAEELMRLCEPGMIDKTRHLVRSGKHIVEVDEFHGENEGLVVAEIELAYEEETYERPAFLGEEVTGDTKFYNSFLMKFPFSKWGVKEQNNKEVL